MRRVRLAIWTVLAVAMTVAPAAALANPFDISIRGLGRPRVFTKDPTTNRYDDPAIRRFRYMASELTMALAPRPLAPAETLGLDGFEFSIVNNVTQISHESGYWKGQPGNPIFEGALTDRQVPTVLWAPTAHIRKGLPLSMEVGFSGSYLAYSEMFMLGVEYKIAWHESFFRWMPALATRIAFSRLFGSSDLDIIAGEVDLLTSLPFGIGGMASVTPYLGYGQLFAHVNSQVIDETPFDVTDPTGDQRGGADGSLYNFPTINWQDNAHGRLVAGLRIIIAFIEVLFEYNYLFMDTPNNLMSWSFKLGFDV